jgi:8-oxo-dGTP pyrophosphatase MutT (NUDIX family)
MTAKWKVLRSETLLKDRWIDLRAETCVTPGGTEIAPYYLFRYPDWVSIVALTEDDEVILVREYRHGMGDFCLGLPAGAVDAEDFDPEQAARRELQEEAGFTAREWRLVASLQAEPSRQGNLIHIFLAQGLTSGAPRRLDMGEEGMVVERWQSTDLLDGLAHGVLPQASQVSALLLALGAAGRLKLK